MGRLTGFKHTEETKAKIRRRRTEDSTITKARRSPSARDLEWAAGFLEGEGSFQHVHRSEVVSAGQVAKEPLTKLQDIFGGTLSWIERQQPHHNDQWRWKVSGARARGIMMTLYALLSSRRQEQIREALQPV